MRGQFLKRAISCVMLFTFLCSSVMPARAQALPEAGKMIFLSAKFTPSLLVGLQVDPKNPFQIDFLIDRGERVLSDAQKSVEYRKLIKYFLAALTIPNNDMWVNLSPFEQGRILPDNFSLTEMGRDLLAQDYILKQITASLIYPEGDVGRKFWAKVYAQAVEKYGTSDIPLDTFNKVWIIPDKAVIYQKNNTALAVESHLKVMLETDYLSMERNGEDQSVSLPLTGRGQGREDVVKDVLREIVIPALEKEVNEGEHFAQLRQIYSAMLMATWFKKTLKQSTLAKAYANKSKVAGVELNDPGAKDRIYQQYLQAYKLGVFNFIKEEKDPLTEEPIPRKYFSGGITAPQDVTVDNSEKHEKKFLEGHSRLECVVTFFRAAAAKARRGINVAKLATVLGAAGLGLLQGDMDRKGQDAVADERARFAERVIELKEEIDKKGIIAFVQDDPEGFLMKADEVTVYFNEYVDRTPESTFPSMDSVYRVATAQVAETIYSSGRLN